MKGDNVEFRLFRGDRAELERRLKEIDPDRKHPMNQPVEVYLDISSRQAAHIEKGLKQADAGEFAGDAEVAAIYERLLR